MGETFVTADLHLAHYNVVLHCNRLPWLYDNSNFDPSKPVHFKFNNPKAVHIESHDQAMIENWNKIVSPNDTVWILGDLAWKYHTKFIMALNGCKYLIRGNHDKMNWDAIRLFKRIDETHHYHFSYYTQINGRRVMLSHCPYESWFSSCHGSWHLHGHCHGRLAERVDMLRFDVGVDAWNYKPVPWSAIEKKMLEKEERKKEYFSRSKKQREQECDEDNDRIENDESSSNVDIVRERNTQYLTKEGVSTDVSKDTETPGNGK